MAATGNPITPQAQIIRPVLLLSHALQKARGVSALGQKRTFSEVCAMSAFTRRIQPVRATPSNLLRGEEVRDGDVTDLVHGSAEGRAVGAMEARVHCCGHLSGAGKEEQDRR